MILQLVSIALLVILILMLVSIRGKLLFDEKLKKDIQESQKKVEFQGKKLTALERHFNVAPWPPVHGISAGFKCFNCGKTYMEDAGKEYSTCICPHCFKVSSNFIDRDMTMGDE